MLDLAVVIVNWNTRDLTLEAIRSLYADLAQSDLQAEVYVVDNASGDGSVVAIAAEFPQVKLIGNDENLGFVRANNQAIRQIMVDPPHAVYLLNSDTITQPGATRALYDALMCDEKIGLVGARLTYGDGSFQHSAFQFPGLRQLWVEFFPTPGRLIESGFNGRYPRELYAGGQPFPVDFTLGATMMLRHEVIQQTGMFDEAIFMYCEEIDWAWRIHHAGWQVLCVPQAHVVHLGGQSSSQIKAFSALRLWESRLLLFRKYYPAWKRWLAKMLVRAGMQLKIQQTRQDTTLSSDARDELLDAYQQIQKLAR